MSRLSAFWRKSHGKMDMLWTGQLTTIQTLLRDPAETPEVIGISLAMVRLIRSCDAERFLAVERTDAEFGSPEYWERDI